MGSAASTRSKDSKVTPHDKAVLKVKLLRDTVKIYLKKVEHSIQYEQDLALQLIQRGQRERAKCILRKQLVLVEYLKTTDRELEMLEETVTALENTGVQAKIFEGLRAGNLALKRAHEVINIKNVEFILEETIHAIEKQEEINKMVNVLGTTISEDNLNMDLDRELETLAEKSGSTILLTTVSKDGSSKEIADFKKKPSNIWFLKTKLKKSNEDVAQPVDPTTSSSFKGKSRKSSKATRNISKPPVVKQVGITINN